MWQLEMLDHLPRCRLAESPRWDGAAWWWLDAVDGRIWSGSPDGSGRFGARLHHYFGERTSLVHPIGAERVVVGGALVRRGTTNPLRRVALLPTAPGEVFNDGTMDHRGRLLIGSVMAGRARDGRLLRVDADGAAEQVRGGFALSNGMAWRADNQLWHADSVTRRIWLHYLDSARSEVFVDSDAFGDAMPDGLASAEDGTLWVACYGAGEIRRFDRAGSLVEVITVPTPQVTSLAVGGPSGRDLLITTAREGFGLADDIADPGAGRLWLARASV